MYGCNHSVRSSLQVHVSKVGNRECLVCASPANSLLLVLASSTSCGLNVGAEYIKGGVIVRPCRKGKPFKVICNMLLAVSKETVWFSPDMLENDFNIISNLSWKID